MTCHDYLSRHSEFVDGLMDAGTAARWRAHEEACNSCARYHRVVIRSLALLVDLPVVEPSDDFSERLQHRVLHLQDEMARHDRFAGSGALASLAIAAALAFVAWGPMLLAGAASARAGSARVVASVPAEHTQSAEGESSLVDWYASAPGMPALGGGSSVFAAFPGPYSPLVVEAPVTRASRRAARAVFATYYPALE